MHETPKLSCHPRDLVFVHIDSEDSFEDGNHLQREHGLYINNFWSMTRESWDRLRGFYKLIRRPPLAERLAVTGSYRQLPALPGSYQRHCILAHIRIPGRIPKHQQIQRWGWQTRVHMPRTPETPFSPFRRTVSVVLCPKFPQIAVKAT